LKESASKYESELQTDLSETKRILNKMAECNKKLRVEKNNSSELRIRENQHAALTEEFFAVMFRYNEVQTAHKEQHKENLARLVKVAVGDEMDEEEIKEKIEKGQIQLETVFSQRLDAADAHTIKATYNQIKETHDDLVKLEESMEELHEMFQDMHTLLQMQGDLLDNIEHNVERGIAYVETGISNLKTAQKMSRRSRNASCILFIVIAVVAGIGILVVLALTGGLLGGLLPKALK
jgi:t-SNARE complex subunit (syntaxin)